MRDTVKPIDYFDKWIEFERKQIANITAWLNSDGASKPEGAVLAAYQRVRANLHVLIMRYSRGDQLAELTCELKQLLPMVADLRRRLEILPPDSGRYRKQFEVLDLDNYQLRLWLIAFSVNLSLSEEDVDTLVTFIGNEGEDVLLDRLVNRIRPGRKIGTELHFARPFQLLLVALDASGAQQGAMMLKFLKAWYPACKRAYWYNNAEGDDRGYVGYWCFEAAAAVKLFGIEHQSFREHPHYPADLLQGAFA